MMPDCQTAAVSALQNLCYERKSSPADFGVLSKAGFPASSIIGQAVTTRVVQDMLTKQKNLRDLGQDYTIDPETLETILKSGDFAKAFIQELLSNASTGREVMGGLPW